MVYHHPLVISVYENTLVGRGVIGRFGEVYHTLCTSGTPCDYIQVKWGQSIPPYLKAEPTEYVVDFGRNLYDLNRENTITMAQEYLVYNCFREEHKTMGQLRTYIYPQQRALILDQLPPNKLCNKVAQPESLLRHIISDSINSLY